MSETLRIFRAGPSDISLATQAIAEVHERPTDPEAIAEFLADQNCFLILAVADDKVIGSLNGYRLRPPHCRSPQFFLSELDVRPDHRRQGIGKKLTAHFVELARAAKAFEVWVLTNRSNPAAIRTYESSGFFVPEGDDVVLQVDL